jgi:hypothetical protein
MKLSSLTDVVYTEAVVDEMARLTDEATVAARAAELLVQAPPAQCRLGCRAISLLLAIVVAVG